MAVSASAAYHSEALLAELSDVARDLRRDSLAMIHRRGAGHPGGSLSCAEIMAALFFHKLNIDPARPDWPERDRFIMSKGHASAILYSALARRGFFPQSDLEGWGALDCHLQGHPDRLKTPGVEMSSGLLGHGIPGDGECQGGIVWEGAMAAAKFRVDRLTAILDYNDVQLDGAVHDIMPLEPLAEKWRAFNWAVLEVNGHNMRQVLEALDTASEIHGRPTIIIARTTKGKGVSFMEDRAYWHGMAPNDAQLAQAMGELERCS
ncbi:MAG: transketolase [Anaerolineae bacterium]|nr:transketolase [Anaerolineae bacterium]